MCWDFNHRLCFHLFCFHSVSYKLNFFVLFYVRKLMLSQVDTIFIFSDFFVLLNLLGLMNSMTVYMRYTQYILSRNVLYNNYAVWELIVVQQSQCHRQVTLFTWNIRKRYNLLVAGCKQSVLYLFPIRTVQKTTLTA